MNMSGNSFETRPPACAEAGVPTHQPGSGGMSGETALLGLAVTAGQIAPGSAKRARAGRPGRRRMRFAWQSKNFLGDERAIFPPLMFWKFSFSLFAFVFLGGRTESFKFSLYKEQVDRVNSLVLYDF